MKSHNNQTEESLRKLISQRFESYEKEPSELLTQSVFDKLRTIRRYRTTQILLAAFLLVGICILGGLLYINKQKQVKEAFAVDTQIRSTQKQYPATYSETQHSKTSTSQYDRLNSAKNTAAMASKDRDRSDKYRSFAGLTPYLGVTQQALISEETDRSTSVQGPYETENQNESPGILDGKSISLYKTTLRMPEPVDNTEHIPVNKTDESRDYHLIVGLIPTSSFQMLNVIPKDGLIYQNFRFAKPASLRSLGYKFQIGIERKGLQFLTNYSQFSHSVTYEVAGSEFVLVRDARNDAKPVRKTTTIYDENSVRQIGVGIKKHLLFTKGALRMQYFDLGAEFTKQLGGNNNAIWLNASFGKQIQITGPTSLTIGPYVEYSLQKFKSANQAYTSTPYQVGVSIGLRLRN